MWPLLISFATLLGITSTTLLDQSLTPPVLFNNNDNNNNNNSNNSSSILFNNTTLTFTNGVKLDDHFDLFWNISQNKNKNNNNGGDDELTMALQVAHLGYIAVGFSPSGRMVGSNAVVGWYVSDQESYVFDYYLGGKIPAKVVVEDNQGIYNQQIHRDSNTGISTLVFSRSMNELNENEINRIIWAQGPVPYVAETTPGDGTTASPLLPLHSHESSASINLDTRELVLLDDDEDVALYAHAIMMIIAFGVFFPFGAFVARFYKHNTPPLWYNWFNIHRWLQVSGFLLSVAAFVVAFLEFDIVIKEEPPLVKAHVYMGIVLMVMTVIQPLFAIIRPKAPNSSNVEQEDGPSTARIWWRNFHILLGYSIIIIAIPQIVIGSVILEFEAFVVVEAFLVCGFLALFVVFHRMDRDKQEIPQYHQNLPPPEMIK